MLPYSAEAYLELLSAYNDDIWPAHLSAYALNIVLLGLLMWPRAGGDRIIAAILALGWGWTGYLYLATYLAPLNWGAAAFGAVFGVQGFLLIWSGTLQDRLRFTGDKSAASWLGLLLIIFALIVYPAGLILTGDGFLAVQHSGLSPNPTTIMTLGVLLLITDRTPFHLFLIPIAWSIVEGATAWALGLWWELSLPIAGLAAIFFAISRPRPA